MKREEAIKLIDTHTVCFYNEIDSPTLQALHLAIDALANRPIIDAVEVVRCKDCRYQVHCYQTVSHTKIHDGFKEYWSEPIEWCSRGERRKP